MKKFFCVVLLLMSSALVASERKIEFQDANIDVNVQQSVSQSEAYCALKEHTNIGFGYQTGQAPNDIIVTYFDPASCATPGYPFLVQSLSFTMIPLIGNSWPVKMDVVIYSSTISGDNCSAPDAELYRFSLDCDSATWAIPNTGTAIFPDTFCISEPFYIGVHYADSFAHAPTYPSILFDTTSVIDSCDNWYYFDVDPAQWNEWYQFWDGGNRPGYPWFDVVGRTSSIACIADTDGDGIEDALDNCPNEYNNLQTDTDADFIGDACDNCPTDYNPMQADSDNDNIGDDCDDCPNDFHNDIDNDSVCESVDNCPGVYNPLQEDADSNGRGDACENCCIGNRGNVNNDPSDLTDISDLVFMVDFIFGSPVGQSPPCFEEADIDGSAGVDITDLVLIVEFIFNNSMGTPLLICP